MSAPKLQGPFPLTETGIDAHVRSESPGVYILGYQRKSLFIVSYVGRDDSDVRRALRTHVSGPYEHFKLAYALSAQEAFLKECDLYHDYTGLDNARHPSPPKGMAWPCACCQATDQEGEA